MSDWVLFASGVEEAWFLKTEGAEIVIPSYDFTATVDRHGHKANFLHKTKLLASSFNRA
jgi:hypothetical protein